MACHLNAPVSLLVLTRWDLGKRAELMSHPLVLLCGDPPFFIFYLLLFPYPPQFHCFMISVQVDILLWDFLLTTFSSLPLARLLPTHTQTHLQSAMQTTLNPTYMHITSYLHHLCNNKVGTCTDLDSLPVEHSAISLFSVNVDKERRTL